MVCSCVAECGGREELNELGYDHPAVVVRICQRENSLFPGDLFCDVACVRIPPTSLDFGTKTTVDYYFQKHQPLPLSLRTLAKRPPILHTDLAPRP